MKHILSNSTVVRYCSVSTVVLALVCLLGWLSKHLILSSFHSNWIMMAPSTGILFCVIGVALWSFLTIQDKGIHNFLLTRLMLIGCMIMSISVIGSYLLGFDSTIENLFSPSTGKLGGIPTGRMSPITASFFLVTCIALFFRTINHISAKFINNVPSILSLIVALFSISWVVGYAHGLPFFYSGSLIPPALPTSICFLTLNIGIFYLFAPISSIFKSFLDASIFGRLVRGLLPFIIGVVLLEGWADDKMIINSVNAALEQTFFSLFLAMIITFIVLLQSRRIDRQLQSAHTKLAESEERFRTLIEQAGDGFELLDATGSYIDANKSSCAMLGYSKKELLELSVPDIDPSKDAAQFRTEFQSLISKISRTFETVHRRKNGTLFPVEVTASIIKHNGTDFAMTMVRDISERKKAEESLVLEKEKLLVTLRSIGDGVIATDTFGKVVIMNKVAETLTGWNQNEALGKPLNSIFNIINENTRKPQINPVNKVLSTGQIFQLANHTVLISKDGLERVIADSAAPIKDTRGVIIGVVLVFRDITEKQKLLDATNKVQKLESLGVLAGGIAHDFNNLMGGIFGYIDIAIDLSKDHKVTQNLSKAINSIERARALTQQLLTFAKGGAPIQHIGNLFPFVQETVHFALSGSNVSCKFDTPKDIWPCNFDENQVGQVIDNIIINAQQAMPMGGTINLTARNIALSEDEHHTLTKGHYVKIAIKDYGIGIPPEQMSRIFDPFFTTKTKGHGLGLTTCFSIINRHDGFIDVESELGKGSTFNIYLPATVGSVLDMPEKSILKHSGTGTFLIMDDEEVMREIIRDMLSSIGYNVVCKENGKDAVECYEKETKEKRLFAGMIFDLTVPGGMGGKAAVEAIRKLNTEIPVFVTSGYAEDPIMKNPTEHGFTTSICKPFRKSELVEMLNKYMKPKK